jgi:hypothetical protein
VLLFVLSIHCGGCARTLSPKHVSGDKDKYYINVVYSAFVGLSFI